LSQTSDEGTPAKPKKGERKVTPASFLTSDVIFVAIAIALNYFVIHPNVVDLFTKPWDAGAQILFGIVAGGIISVVVILYVTKTHAFDAGMMADSFAQLAAYPYWLLLSAGFTAGFAEELLMRGTIQVIAGIWIASILFMLAHFWAWGPKPHTIGKGVFALLVFIAGVATGYTFIAVGLTAVFVAHSILDMSMFATIKRHFLERRLETGQATTPKNT
jgi:membrane protease YdiL (CAAX protease family)